MEKKTTTQCSSSSHLWERLEALVREQIQRFIQAMLEEEVATLLGRRKSARHAAVDASKGVRNGYGKPRRLTLTAGTITVRRPRVRGLDERFISRVLPLCKHRPQRWVSCCPSCICMAWRWGTSI
jgi:putative transposase